MCQPKRQRPTVTHIHHEEWQAAVNMPGGMHRAHVGVSNVSGYASLLEKARRNLAIVKELGPQHLHRDVKPKLFVQSSEYLRSPTASEPRHQAIAFADTPAHIPALLSAPFDRRAR